MLNVYSSLQHTSIIKWSARSCKQSRKCDSEPSVQSMQPRRTDSSRLDRARVIGTHPASPTAAGGGSGLTITPPPLSFRTMPPPPLSFGTSSLEGDLVLPPCTLWLGVNCGDSAIWILRR